jgi:hypothetical protein
MSAFVSLYVDMLFKKEVCLSSTGKSLGLCSQWAMVLTTGFGRAAIPLSFLGL